jgi:uncharacterized protein (TIGR03790 family)
MSPRYFIATLIVNLIFTPALFGLEPNEILIIANGNLPASVRIAGHYCKKRGVPPKNIIALPLGTKATDTINRVEYEKQLAGPLRDKLSSPEFSGKLKCLLTTYGVPFRVEGRGPIKGQEKNLKQLQKLSQQKTRRLKRIIEKLVVLGLEKGSESPRSNPSQGVKALFKVAEIESKASLARIRKLAVKKQQKQDYKQWLDFYRQLFGTARAFHLMKSNPEFSSNISAAERKKLEKERQLIRQIRDNKWNVDKRIGSKYYDSVAGVNGLLQSLEDIISDIDRLKGRETGASVDSELSMVLFGDYELYRWQPNELKERIIWTGLKTFMVSRLDGPGEQIAKGLVDKAIAAEQNGLKGTAYIDSRGLEYGEELYSQGYFDKSLQDTALLIKTRTKMPVVEERMEKLFEPGQCPQTAIYCGWYSLKNYIDAFDFADGAVGYHIASWEAVHLRDPNSREWCPAMLMDGITATLGAVAEPYLRSFPNPKVLFSGLLSGQCLVESYYRAKPFNSWQLVLIGDPLYKPFKRPKKITSNRISRSAFDGIKQ